MIAGGSGKGGNLNAQLPVLHAVELVYGSRHLRNGLRCFIEPAAPFLNDVAITDQRKGKTQKQKIQQDLKKYHLSGIARKKWL